MEISTLPAGFRELLTVPTGHSYCFIELMAFKTRSLNQLSFFGCLIFLESNRVPTSCCAQSNSVGILDEKA